ncbi:MGMT family protein [Pseudomonas oryzihabitans]|uniref:Methylated-DNA-protein-cysteine methyltransferase-like protein n=1 Tax=Pseudomonas oryzihabitans TaxID=47885 RepID=A0AAJ2BFX1_9PSED|nr:MGMT family protein [Pseudomonas psychrotolerans]MDR6233506.1 methylated-DNA-protein-cysteine methyltransferase-like protein [Pseudomonas psychrotolerans]MDR6357454.1 methylated-DNA-protein-cysteine methyltransferase-like protein [Pseudomonas psychrotolerans]
MSESSAPDPRRQALFQALAAIPPGRVVSYGQLAELAGLGRGARWAGWMLGRLPKGSTLPWHRVIAADGRPSLTRDSPSGREQRERLRAEGVMLHEDRVDMRRYRWNPAEGVE